MDKPQEETPQLRASELIAALQKQISVRGDLPVLFFETRQGEVQCCYPVQEVRDRDPDERKPEIWIAGGWT